MTATNRICFSFLLRLEKGTGGFYSGDPRLTQETPGRDCARRNQHVAFCLTEELLKISCSLSNSFNLPGISDPLMFKAFIAGLNYILRLIKCCLLPWRFAANCPSYASTAVPPGVGARQLVITHLPNVIFTVFGYRLLWIIGCLYVTLSEALGPRSG